MCCQSKQPLLHPGMRETDINPLCPPNRINRWVSSPSHYPYLGWGEHWDGTGSQKKRIKLLGSKSLPISNFLNLYIPTDGIGVKSHKIHFLALSLAGPALCSYNPFQKCASTDLEINSEQNSFILTSYYIIYLIFFSKISTKSRKKNL